MNKKIIICSDGTWSAPDQKEGKRLNPTNVAKMARAITPTASNGKQQVIFYDWGIGADQQGFRSRITAGLKWLRSDLNHSYVKNV